MSNELEYGKDSRTTIRVLSIPTIGLLYNNYKIIVILPIRSLPL